MHVGWRFIITVVAGLAASSPAMVQAQDCSIEPLCTQMSGCAEADIYFRQCGHHRRDADDDGIPCETLCGDTFDLYLQRRSVGTMQPLLSTPEFACEGKRRCGEMISCEEAQFYLNQCGIRSLDGDGDGRPCSAICR